MILGTLGAPVNASQRRPNGGMTRALEQAFRECQNDPHQHNSATPFPCRQARHMIYMTYILLGTSIPITFMTLTMILARFFFLGT